MKSDWGQDVAVRAFAGAVSLALASVVSVTVVGCHTALISFAQVGPESGWSMTNYGGGRFLAGPDTSILVRASNSTDESEHTWFGVSLWFDPKRPNLRYSPEVSLSLPGARNIKPEHILVKWTGANRGGWECGRGQRKEFPGPPYALERGFCMELYFAIKPPTPDVPFTLHLGRIVRDSSSVALPPIQFVKGASMVIDLPLFP